MSIKKIIPFLLITFTFIIPQTNENLCRYVDPFIGTGGHGHTYPGATVPFGMVQLSPDAKTSGWDWCSGYHYSDSTISGFSHTHLSGTGAADYGDILFMPFTGEINKDSNYEYRSAFSHKNESASPGYYSVFLDNFKTKAEFTVTERTGLHKYTFPSSTDQHVLIDLIHGISDKCIGTELNIIDDYTVEGFRRSRGWAKDHTVYFYAVFSKPISSHIKYFNGCKLILSFDSKNETLIVKVGISHTSIEGARGNLQKELSGWDFALVKKNAETAWNKYLNIIQVEGGTDKQKRIFYASLYHTMVVPNVLNDADGSYIGMDRKIHKTTGEDMYTVFSLWDTFRAANPLYSIILPDKYKAFVSSLIQKSKEAGTLPVWELASNETWCMIGSPAIPVIADAVMKGFLAQKEIKDAWESVKKTVMEDTRGMNYYKEYGFIPADKDDESVSQTLEYSYADWCASLIAKQAGDTSSYISLLQRAQYYKNVYDSSTKFFRARSNGNWKSPFDPFSVSGDYTEANAWQYAFFVPQDIKGLANLFGGKKELADRLDSLFNAATVLNGLDQPDITGLIGQYVHGNEPSHHIAYLYNYCGQQWKTAEKVSYILDKFYDDQPDGLIGNEDCGQMSAWYVLSAMGFYPVVPGSNEYAFGSPIFNKVTINYGNRKKFTIDADNVNSKNFYIKSAMLNNKPYNKSFIAHSTITNNGELKLTMSDSPNKEWGTGANNIPVTEINIKNIIPVPVINSSGKSFSDSMLVEIIPTLESTVYFTLDGSTPDKTSSVYSNPFYIKNNTTVKALSCKEGYYDSKPAVAEYYKTIGGKKVTYLTKYSDLYTAGGDNALIDGIRGPASHHTGAWQGFSYNDLDVVVDLGSIQNIHELSIGFLQNVTAWIFFPDQVEYFSSPDGVTFVSLGIVENKISHENREVLIQDFTKQVENVSTRYIRIKAKNIGLLPAWHVSAGEKAWIFADEINVLSHP